MLWRTSPFLSTLLYVLYQTSKNHTGVESPEKQGISWEVFQILLTEKFLKNTSVSIVNTGQKSVEVL